MYHLFHFESYGGKQPLDDADYTQSVKHPVIIHFVGPEKPWIKTINASIQRHILKIFKENTLVLQNSGDDACRYRQQR